MAKDWKVESRSTDLVEQLLEVGSLGLYRPTHDYEVVNKESGDRRTVSATDRSSLGRKISRGEFNND